MARAVRWTLAAVIAAVVLAWPVYYYRSLYAHSKRLRVVVPGRLYRCGQLTAEGFADAVRRYGIRTIVNLQNDFPDPDVQLAFLGGREVKETDLCRELGVRYVLVSPDLVPHSRESSERPRAVDDMLAVYDDERNYPMLIHCKAGLHRTGVLAAVYRMEYQGWTPERAWQEMRLHGFGDHACTSANDYVRQYVLTYRQGLRLPAGVARGPGE